MGCPPDPIDVSISYARDRILGLGERYQTLLIERTNSISLLKKFPESNFPTIEFSKDKFDTTITDFPNEQNLQADLDQIYSKEDASKKRLKALEIYLCDLRCEILNLSRQFPDRLSSLEIESELSIHKLHREEDRNVWTAWLEEKLSLYQFLLEDDSVGDSFKEERKSKFHGLLEKIQGELKRVSTLNEEEILYNNKSFGKNPEEFV